MHPANHLSKTLRNLAVWIKQDATFCLMLSVIFLVSTWLLLTPIWSRVSHQTMLRFHLQSQSFAAWACQFPIPAMYNFANQYEIDEYPPGLIDPLFDTSQPRFLNHFPSRCFTFADARGEYLREGTNQWFTLTSSYRGQKLTSKFHLKPSGTLAPSEPHRRYEVIRISTETEYVASK